MLLHAVRAKDVSLKVVARTSCWPLNRGAVACWFRPTHIASGQKCALKFCPVAEMDDLKNEIGMQSISKHPNIVNVREAFVTKTEVGAMALSMSAIATAIATVVVLWQMLGQ